MKNLQLNLQILLETLKRALKRALLHLQSCPFLGLHEQGRPHSQNFLLVGKHVGGQGRNLTRNREAHLKKAGHK